MAKTPPEKLAAALRANLKRRKQQPPPSPATDLSKDPEKIGENPLAEAGRPPLGT
jgi:hypothetical protein